MGGMKYWLLKTEPGEYAFDELVAAGARGDMWDGVRNHQAANFMRGMAAGDHALIYHSGRAREIVGSAEITRAAYPDPTDDSGRFVAVDLRALDTFESPVSLAAIKADAAFNDFLLVRQARLSVMPVTRTQWQRIERMASAG